MLTVNAECCSVKFVLIHARYYPAQSLFPSEKVTLEHNTDRTPAIQWKPHVLLISYNQDSLNYPDPNNVYL